MASASNPSTDLETGTTSAEVGPFEPWLSRSRYPIDLDNQKVK